ncbi:MAG TPA: type II secretion system F family protein [Acidiferrobacteraceae bacterium]|nr:type II secretion system F family protein [Acidiferrobacteraceae bacterium]
MPAFQYRGRNGRGEAVHGQLDAATADALADQLLNSGVTPIDIRVASATTDVWATLRAQLSGSPVSLEDLALFCRQMYTLARSGVPLMQALRGLQTTAQNVRFGAIIAQLSDSLDSGTDLSSALKRHPKVFPPLFVSLVQMGESTGRLDEAFAQLAKYLDLERQTRLRIKAAMRYPIFVLVAITVAVGVINVFVIPAFARLYASFHAQLPLPTRILIATSNFTIQHGWQLLLAAVAAVLGIRAYVRSEAGRYRWHRLKLRLPLVGDILYRAMLGRFSRSLAVMMSAGVPLIQAMTVVARAVDNDFIAARVLQMRDGIERGETITRTAAATSMFSPLVLQMMAVGEEAGAVDSLMNDVAEYYERAVDYDVERLSSVIEPVLIVAIGGLVLILALGVFLPMWDLAHAAGAG